MAAHSLHFALGLLVLAAGLASCGEDPASGTGAPGSARATYVDPAKCATCHVKPQRAWEGSHHHLAMQEATEATVLADFDDAEVTFHGVTTRFYRDGDRFMVRTDGIDGRATDFEVTYVFGLEPLQQYLVAFPDGRVQCLLVAWGTVEREWFFLYDEPIPHDDPLHWTGLYQNWNYMCAECHTTDLRRNYDLEHDTYATTFFDINVGCQACHGPGSRHVAWAERMKAGSGTYREGEDTGLAVDLKAEDPAVQVETCARCHARRNIVHGEYEHGAPLLDAYEPELLVAPLYHPDGQILDEVYVYGSFLQAKKHAAGVRCTDCHDPHTAQIEQEGNALCVECHREAPPERFPTLEAKVYDDGSHHHHEEGTPGAHCVDCHMPASVYMQVDPRRDHGFRIPRPDLTAKIGVPNTCNGCHDDRTPAWASETIARWFPESAPERMRTPHFAEAFAAARRTDPKAMEPLIRVAGDLEQPAIVRATAVRELGRYPERRVLQVLASALQDPDGLVRATAVDGIGRLIPGGAPPPLLQAKAELLQERLDDPVRLVRTEAARVLAGMPRANLTPDRRRAFERALGEFRGRQDAVRDRPDAHLNLGVLEEDLGRAPAAEKAYRTALRLDPDFLPARFNLAMLLNRQARNPEAEAQLREVLKRQPTEGEAHYSLGLLLAEMERFGDAATSLSRAAALMPGRPRVAYNHALVLQRLGRPGEAEAALQKAHALDASNAATVQALALLYLEQRRFEEARSFAVELVGLAPGAPEPRRLLERIESEARR